MLIAGEYKPWVIKDYYYWTLLLHAQKQNPYVGRCYAWWKDRAPAPNEGEGLRPDAIPDGALLELHKTITADVMIAWRHLGYPTREYGSGFLINICTLANEPVHNHHLHTHFVPRWNGEARIPCLELSIIDPEWGKNFARFNGHFPHIAQELGKPGALEKIRSTMAGAIDKLRSRR